MAANRIGQLYQYSGEGSIPLLKEPNTFSYNDIGRIETNVPFLILEKYDIPWTIENAPRHEYWIKVLYKEQVGWVKSTYVNLDWVDPEEYV